MGLKQSSHGLACPSCDQDEDLVIQLSGWYHLTNTDPHGDDGATAIEAADSDDRPYPFDETSQASCWVCCWAGRVEDCVASMIT